MKAGSPTALAARPPKRPRTGPDFLEPSLPEVMRLEKDWRRDAKGIRFVVDCQPLANVLNGTAPWLDPNITGMERTPAIKFTVGPAGMA